MFGSLLLLIAVAALAIISSASNIVKVNPKVSDPFFQGNLETLNRQRKLAVQSMGYYKLTFFSDSACGTTAESHPTVIQAEYSSGCFRFDLDSSNVADGQMSYSYADLGEGNCNGLKRVAFSDLDCTPGSEVGEITFTINDGEECKTINGEVQYQSVKAACMIGDLTVEPGMLVNKNYADNEGSKCDTTLFSFYAIPHDKCIHDTSYTKYKSSVYHCDGKNMVTRKMYMSSDCSESEGDVMWTFPTTTCASLPVGDFFSQTCT